MKKSVLVSIGLVALCVLGIAATVSQDQWFTGLVDINQDNLRYGGTAITATAAELNKMDGVTVTAAQLNAAGGGSTATITPTVVSNSLAKVYGSNLVVVTGGTMAIPDGTLAVGDTALAAANIIVGNANGVGVAKALTGDATITSNGVLSTVGVLTTNIVISFGTTNITFNITNGLIKAVSGF